MCDKLHAESGWSLPSLPPHDAMATNEIDFRKGLHSGDHLCQAASTIICRVASMPEQGENNKDACVASLVHLNNANLVHHTKAALRGTFDAMQGSQYTFTLASSADLHT
ncbi:hypothetical protein WJX82_001881 [Trebouxia sp. C0006]